MRSIWREWTPTVRQSRTTSASSLTSSTTWRISAVWCKYGSPLRLLKGQHSQVHLFMFLLFFFFFFVPLYLGPGPIWQFTEKSPFFSSSFWCSFWNALKFHRNCTKASGNVIHWGLGAMSRLSDKLCMLWRSQVWPGLQVDVWRVFT